MACALCGGAALAVLAALLLAFAGDVSGKISFSVNIGRFDGLWLLPALPLLLAVLLVLAAPLAYALYRLAGRLRGGAAGSETIGER